MTSSPGVTARAGMLVRRPVSLVFEALVDPAITTRFWFSRGSARLDAATDVRWDWDTYSVSAQVHVLAVETNRRIQLEWAAPGGATMVEWIFTPRADDTTFVSVANWGFTGAQDEIATQAIGSTEGFALVLAGLKAFLEHGVILNLVPDRFPEGLGGS